MIIIAHCCIAECSKKENAQLAILAKLYYIGKIAQGIKWKCLGILHKNIIMKWNKMKILNLRLT